MSQNKSFLASWKFWAWIIIFIIVIVAVTKRDPIYVENTINPTAQKLQDSREYFYKSCMWTWSIYAPGSKEYKDMDESCKKWMQAINNPDYKAISTK